MSDECFFSPSPPPIILQASEEASLRALESLMTEFFHNCTTNERKREIGTFCHATPPLHIRNRSFQVMLCHPACLVLGQCRSFHSEQLSREKTADSLASVHSKAIGNMVGFNPTLTSFKKKKKKSGKLSKNHPR